MPRKCVLFVHGIGPQLESRPEGHPEGYQKGYSDVLWDVLWDGQPPDNVFKYEVFYYDIFDRMNVKTGIQDMAEKYNLADRLASVVRNSEFAGTIADKLTEVLRDTVSHVFYFLLHDDSRTAILHRFKQALLQVVQDSAAEDVYPKGIELTVVSHSLGTVVAYAGMRDIIENPALGVAVGFRARTLFTLASPLGLIKELGEFIGANFPGMTGGISRPLWHDPDSGVDMANVKRWYSYREKPDPVASLLRMKGDFLDNDPDMEPFFFTDTHGAGVHAFKGYIEQARELVLQRIEEG